MELRYMLLILILVFATGCTQKIKEPMVYSEKAVSFTCPADWSFFNDNIFNDNKTHYHTLICGKNGGSGTFTMLWFDSEQDNSKFADTLISAASKKGIEVPEPENVKFSDNPALLLRFTFLNIIAQSSSSTVILFNCNGKSISLMFQEAVEDHEKNLDGFNQINSSIKC